jgi:TolA-binding protein
MPLTHGRLGRLYEKMDQPQKARAAYERFIEAWDDADPALQDRVNTAHRRVKELAGETAE